MKSPQAVSEVLDLAAASRPTEIEPKTNLYIVHPASRALVPVFYRLGFSPNAVSILGAGAAALAAACFLWLPWPWNGVAGFLLLVVRHILDGADGLLARVSGKASSVGDMVDGLCDAFALFVVQTALAIHLSAELGPTAYLVAVVGTLSYIVQVNAYEGRRRQYMHWVYGRSMVTSDPGGSAAPRRGPVMRLVLAIYASYFAQPSFESAALSAEMGRRVSRGGRLADQARRLYRSRKQQFVSTFGLLGENHKTIATGVAMLAGSALYLYAYLFAVLNVALIALFLWQRRLDAQLAHDLAAAEDTATEDSP